MSSKTLRTGIKAAFAHQRKSILLFILSWCCLVLYIFLPDHEEYKAELSQNSNHTAEVPPANFHLLVPASKPEPNLCKLILSAAVTGYPAPVLINWGKAFEDAQYVEGGSHLAKITGIHDYLSQLGPDEDESLVLLVDGFDVWMQLRPQTLIDRYFDINRRAQERLDHRLGHVAYNHGIRQEIVFGCQKRCWPWAFEDPPCYAAPESSLPGDIFGPQTDTSVEDEANPYVKYRPRYLNSGVGIGTVKAMRKLFKRAITLLETERNMGSDQYIFSHILGDQEVWREIVRRKTRGRLGEWSDGIFSRRPKIVFNEEHVKEVGAKAAEQEDQNLEFGLGLDYGSEIGLNTVFAEDDTAWLTWSNDSQLRAAEKTRGISPEASRIHDLAPDISQTIPPFGTSSSEDLPSWTPWRDVSLFTNVWTGTVPAIIHHNAHRDGRKALRETWWDRIWFQKYARGLYDAQMFEPIVPIARSGYDGATQREWWPSETGKGGARDGSGEATQERWVRFDDMCREYHEEIFRDGEGPWEAPIVQ
ncbi:hypothetical protein PRZ48_014499 [Zasmidium cellare]|uniref:Uncharacterized protein n=1 Tax=Zasmidium cellare TaxID=395010 RepID=A0ABR0DZ36_ZASCE|nr:hypothetical protein PRZ48_014499 [Zasmidium cellare]